jgi:hypothetical protein
MKAFMIATLVLMLTGCFTEPVQRTPAGNGFSVGLLFELDDCKVYRFMDGGSPVYFSNCSGGTTVSHTEHRMCGKTPCDHTVIETTGTSTNRGQ